MSRALALAVLLLVAAAAVAPLASAEGVESIVPGAKELAGAGSTGAKKVGKAVGADPEPEVASGLPADPAPDARP